MAGTDLWQLFFPLPKGEEEMLKAFNENRPLFNLFSALKSEGYDFVVKDGQCSGERNVDAETCTVIIRGIKYLTNDERCNAVVSPQIGARILFDRVGVAIGGWFYDYLNPIAPPKHTVESIWNYCNSINSSKCQGFRHIEGEWYISHFKW